MQPAGLQELIHKFEEGEGAKSVRLLFFLLALLGLAALWHIREAKSFASIEAMDSAQIARNLSQGRGFTTQFIRPLSLALLEKHRGDPAALLREPHPDISNAPVYPLLLGALMKLLPVDWAIPQGRFWRYQPEIFIGILNQALFFAALFLVFRLAANLFDRAVAYLAVVLLALTELFWEFTTSGLSTMLLIVLFLALLHLLARLDSLTRDAPQPKARLLALAAAAGLLVGLMALTRYSMGWLIIPVVVFIAAITGGLRAQSAALAVLSCAIVLAPWLWRNYSLSETLFGTAGYTIHHGTTILPGNTLERSMPKNLDFELNKIQLEEYPRKLFLNGGDILLNELPQAAGNWILAFFAGALLIQFRNPVLSRLKLFLTGSLLLLVVIEALGKTELSSHAPRVNSENLLVIITPVFFIYGCAFFFILLDQIQFPIPWLRSVAITGFILVLSLPLIFRLLPPRNISVAYPPYYPPLTQAVSGWLLPEELMMSDMPWAVAWYGDRQCVWTTLDAGAQPSDDFYRINDEFKSIKGIYLTQITTNARFLSEMRQSREGIWGKFYLDVVVLKNLPTGFPVKIVPPGLLPDQLFLTDRIRWRQKD